MSAILLLIAINTSLLINDVYTYRYASEGSPGVLNDIEHWGGTCESGENQSPIDLNTHNASKARYEPLVLRNYDQAVVRGNVVIVGNTIKVNIDPRQNYTMSGGGLADTYIMDQLHFHWSSEHTVDKKRFALEMHVVSHRQNFANLAEAIEYKTGVAVLAVFFQPSTSSNIVLQNIVDTIADAETQKPVPLLKELIPADLLPENTQNYIRYEGSLTTPPCAESVIWTVLMDPVELTMNQVDRLTQITDEAGIRVMSNYRSEQRLNFRHIIHVNNV